MKITTITMGVKRTVRHKMYVMSKPVVKLTGDIEVGETYEEAVDKLHDEMLSVMADMIVEEKIIFQEEENAIKDKRRELKTWQNSKHKPAPGDDVPF